MGVASQPLACSPGCEGLSGRCLVAGRAAVRRFRTLSAFLPRSSPDDADRPMNTEAHNRLHYEDKLRAVDPLGSRTEGSLWFDWV